MPDLLYLATLSDAYNRPEWSPLDPFYALRGHFSKIFVREWFLDLSLNPPSLTQVRRLSKRLATLDRSNSLPDWIPFLSFSPEHFVDFVALAVANGPSAALDFVTILADEAKLTLKIENSLLKLFENPNSPVEPLIALEPLGLSPFYPAGMIFCLLARTLPDRISRDAQYAILDWYAIDDGDDILRAEAHRILKYPAAAYHDFAFRFLNPTWTPASTEGAASAPEATSPESPKQESPPNPSAVLAILPPSRTKIVWQPPALPDGVEFSNRALRELRKEGVFAEHRLIDAIDVLQKYRQLKLREITPDDYQIACREKRYLDTRCFADQSSFTAFAPYYEIQHNGRKMKLERHLKWGKSNNSISSMYVYYAWDDATKTVVIGSAPRHLPVWNTK